MHFCKIWQDHVTDDLTLREVFKYGVFSVPYSARMQENTDQKKLHIWTLFTQWL